MIPPWPLLVALTTVDPAGSPPQSPAITHVSSPQRLSGQELLRIGEIHDLQLHFHEALNYYRLALSTFREQNQSRGIAATLVKIARLYEGRGSNQDAYAALEEAIPLLTGSPNGAARARALVVMGRVSARLGYIEQARTSFTQALSLFTRLKARRDWHEAAVGLGLLQVGDGLSEEGIGLLQQAWEDARTRRDPDQQLTALVALGTAHWLLENSPEARRYYDDALRLAPKNPNMAVEAALRFRLAHLEGAAGQVQEGLELGKRALPLAQTLRDTDREAAILALLADLYGRLGQPAEMEDSEQRALTIYRSRQITVHGGR